MAKQRGKSTDRFLTFEEVVAQLRRVISLAQEEALALGYQHVTPEHLLLGVLHTEDGAAARALQQLGVRLQGVREAVDLTDSHRLVKDEGEHGLTQDSKDAIILAMSEARRLHSDDVGAAHVLLGLCHGDSLVRLLQNLGIKPEQVRAAVLRELGDGPLNRIRHSFSARQIQGESRGIKTNVITCRIDGDDLDAIDALVEAGVRTTRSDAAAWLIHVGIEANRSLIDRVYTTVAEIRSLRSEAQTLARGVATRDSAVNTTDGDTTDTSGRRLPE